MKTKVIGTHVSFEMADAVAKLADRQGVTVSEFMRSVLEDVVDTDRVLRSLPAERKIA